MINFIVNKLNILNIENKCISVYSSEKKQVLLNVSIIKPLLILVLKGKKVVGDKIKHVCDTGDFVFFSSMQSIHMRNIPDSSKYLALLIEFDFSDFEKATINIGNTSNVQKMATDYKIGKPNDSLYKCLIQFIDCLEWASQEIIDNRKVEIINVLTSLGCEFLINSFHRKKISEKVIELIEFNNNITHVDICKEIGLSEATLYRKLTSEGKSFKKLKDKVLMGKAIHLLQTTNISISNISEMVGYSSSVRFNQRFKSYFGLTPKELKNTK